MNILLIAPTHADLPDVGIEVGTIASQHRVELLQGDDARETVIARILRNQRFDVIWWATHGTKDGLLLTDGWLSLDGVAQYVRNSKARLCVVNTCESMEIAQTVVEESDADAICTVSEVPDRTAMRTGVLLSSALARHRNPYDAYLEARPGGGLYYRYVANPKRVMYSKFGEQSDIETELAALGDRLSSVESVVMRLDRIVSGSEEYGLSGLKNDMSNVRDAVADMQATLTSMSRSGGDLPIRHLLFTLGAAAAGSGLVVLVIMALAGGGIP